jgi:hypothetical protein
MKWTEHCCGAHYSDQKHNFGSLSAVRDAVEAWINVAEKQEHLELTQEEAEEFEKLLITEFGTVIPTEIDLLMREAGYEVKGL